MRFHCVGVESHVSNDSEIGRGMIFPYSGFVSKKEQNGVSRLKRNVSFAEQGFVPGPWMSIELLDGDKLCP
jgi:hypothetical protein